MNSNTETWASKGENTLGRGSRSEMSSGAFFGSLRHQATPMRFSNSHAESEYQVAGHDFGGRPKMMEKDRPISANEDPINDLHQALKNQIQAKVRGPTAVFSSMGGNRSTPITVIDLDGETRGHLHHYGNHKPYHARHPIMLESGDMYFGLSQTFFGTPRDGAMQRASTLQKDRQANMGSPAMDIGNFFQEPNTSSSSRPNHHIEPFNAPAHRIHATSRAHGTIHKDSTQHRAVHRHDDAPIGTPEMHLDAIFKEPAWYTSSSTSGSKKSKKESRGGYHSHHVDPFNAPVHLIHPAVSHPSSHQEHHLHGHEHHREYLDEEGYYTNHQPIHGRHSYTSAIYKHPTQHRPVNRHHNAPVGTPEMHLDTLFQEPAWYTTGGAKVKSKKAIKKAAKKAAMKNQLGSHHVDAFNAPVHLIHPVTAHAHSSHHVDEEGYYMNHQPIHGHHLSHHDVHMFSIPNSRSTHSSSHTSSHQLSGSKSGKTKSDFSGHHAEGHLSYHDDHNKKGYYMNHQPIHGYSHHDSAHGTMYKHPTQHRLVHRHHNAPISTPEMHLDAVFKEPTWYSSLSSSAGPKGKKVPKSQQGGAHHHHIDPFNAPAHQIHAMSQIHPVPQHDAGEEGYYMNHQPIHGNSQHIQHHDWAFGAAYRRPNQRHVDHHHNAAIGTPEMHLDAVFKEPAWYSSSSSSGSKKAKKAAKHQAGPQFHHVEPFNAPAHLTRPMSAHSQSAPCVDEEGYYMNNQPIHGHSQHHDWTRGAVYKHPTQHRTVNRHHNAPIGTPEMHLDAVFKEPAWYSSTMSSARSTGKGKKAAKSQHYVEPFNAPAHLIHPTVSHGQSTPHHVDDEEHYMNHQPIHGHAQSRDWSLGHAYKRPTQHAMLRQHNARSQTPEMHLGDLFKEPAWYASSTSGTKGKKAAKRQQDAGHLHHIDPFNAPVHLLHPVAYHSQPAPIHHVNEEGYYLNHQPIHGWQHQDSTHGATYKHPTQHRMVHRHHNAPIGTPEMHLDAVFKEPAWYSSTMSSARSTGKGKKAAKSQHYVEPFNAPAHLIHPTVSHGQSTPHHVDDEEHYMNHQPIHGHAQSRDWSLGHAYKRPTQHAMLRQHNARSQTPEMHLGDLFKEPAWYASSTSGTKGKKAAKRQQDAGHLHHIDPFNAPVHLLHPVAYHSQPAIHHVNEEGYYLNHQPIHGRQHQDSTHGATYKHPTQHRMVHRHHNAPIGTPEMHLDAVFKEPAWYSSTMSSARSTGKGKKAAKSQHHVEPFNAPAHLIHPTMSHGQSTLRHVDDEEHYMNHQPIHGYASHGSSQGPIYKRPTQHRAVHRPHNAPIGTPEMHLDAVFKEPAWYASSATGSKAKKSAKNGVYSHHVDPFNAPVHLLHHPVNSHSHLTSRHVDEERDYRHHQPNHDRAQPHHQDWDLGPAYKHPAKRAIHQHNNASIGTPDMHLDAVFKEPDWYTSSSSSGSKKGKKALQRQQNGHSLIYPAASHSPSKPQHKDEDGYYMNHQPIHLHAQHPDSSHGTPYKHQTQHRAVHRHHNAPIGTPEMHLDALFKEPASWTRSRGVKASTGHYVEPLNAPAHRMKPAASHAQPSAHHDDEETYYLNHQPTSGHHHNLRSREEPSHAPVKNPQRKMEGSAVWNVGSLSNHTPSWAMHAHLPAKKSQRKAEDSTVWNLGSLLDDTPSWAIGAHLPTRKPQRKAEDSTVWNLGSLFDDTTSVRSSKDNHAAKPLSVTSSSSLRHQPQPLTVDQIARVAVPIGQTETYTTVIRTTVTLMGVPSSLAHDAQHIQAERGHVLTDFSGPVSRAGQTSIWVRKESSKEMFEGDRMVCQNCRRSLSRL